VRRYGQTATVEIHRLTCLWHRSHRERSLTTLLLGGDRSRKEPYELALISTDLDASSVELVERFARRWSIYVAFEDAKQVVGVGEARNRTVLAVKRTVPFGLLCMSLTIIWHTLHGHSPTDVAEHRALALVPHKRPPRRQPTCSPSSDARSSPLNIPPGSATRPVPRKINPIQQAWAAALP
jgi:hypothetical protein